MLFFPKMLLSPNPHLFRLEYFWIVTIPKRWMVLRVESTVFYHICLFTSPLIRWRGLTWKLAHSFWTKIPENLSSFCCYFIAQCWWINLKFTWEITLKSYDSGLNRYTCCYISGNTGNKIHKTNSITNVTWNAQQ